MRKLLLFALLASLTGCQSLGGMFGGGSRKPDPVPVSRSPDPLYSPDLDGLPR